MARDRKTRAVQRLLRRYGEVMSFQRYVLTKDKAKGSQASAAAGDPVSARAALIPAEESVDRRLHRGDEVLIVDGKPFAGGPDLADGWTVTPPGGAEIPISEGVAALRTRSGDPVLYYETVVRRGATAGVAGGG